MVEEREKMREYDSIYTFSFSFSGGLGHALSGSTGIQDSDALNRITLKSNMGFMDKYPAISPNTPLPGQYCR